MSGWIPYVISGVASVFAAAVAAWSAVKVAKVNADVQEKKEQQEEKERKQKEYDDFREDLVKRIELLEKACKCMLRGDIIRSYNHYKEKKYIPIYGLENVNEEFDVYEKLHGNGTVPELVEDLKELPHEPPN